MSKLPEWPKGNEYPDRATAVAYVEASMTPTARRYVSLEKQRMILARAFLYPHPCPNCEEPMPVVDAIHVEGDDFVCSRCEAKLIFTVPIIATGPTYWEWRLAPHQIPVSQESEKP